jgi:hypothetical protein
VTQAGENSGENVGADPFWGAPDEFRDELERTYARTLHWMAARIGQSSVNGAQPSLRESQANPGLVTPSAYLLGDAFFHDGSRAPYMIGVLDEGHKQFPRGKVGADMIITVLQAAQTEADPRDLRIAVVDSDPGRFAAFGNRGPGLFTRYAEPRGLLDAFAKDVWHVHDEVLSGRWESLRDMAADKASGMQAAGHRTEPWRLGVIMGNGKPLSQSDTEKVKWVARHGKDCGVSLLLHDVPLPNGVEHMNRVGLGIPRFAPRKRPTDAEIARVSAAVSPRFTALQSAAA